MKWVKGKEGKKFTKVGPAIDFLSETEAGGFQIEKIPAGDTYVIYDIENQEMSFDTEKGIIDQANDIAEAMGTKGED